MFFRNALAVLPVILSLGSALALPITPSATTAVVERCATCGTTAPGSGVATGITSITDIDLSLRTFTSAHFDYTGLILDVFADVKTNLTATTDVVLTIGAQLYTWTDADLVVLSTALDAYIGGSLNSTVDIFVKAGIEITSFTVVQATCLKTFIHTVIAANVDLALDVKTDLLLWVGTSLNVTSCTVVSLQTKIDTCLKALTSVVASLKLDVTLATCSTAAVALKLAIKTYIQSCIKTSTGLLALLVKIPLATLLAFTELWIGGDVTGASGSALTLLGINLKLVSDLKICQSIVSVLLKLNSSLNVYSALGLNASVVTTIFSSVKL